MQDGGAGAEFCPVCGAYWSCACADRAGSSAPQGSAAGGDGRSGEAALGGFDVPLPPQPDPRRLDVFQRLKLLEDSGAVP